MICPRCKLEILEAARSATRWGAKQPRRAAPAWDYGGDVWATSPSCAAWSYCGGLLEKSRNLGTAVSPALAVLAVENIAIW